MTNVIPFQFQSNQLRIIRNEYDEPWFCAKDVCAILGYANPNDIIKKLCRSEGISTRYPLQTAGGIQYLAFINEGNLYRLIIKSNKQESEPFESWVCDEVLPSIRKTGSYAAQGAEPPTIAKAQQGELHTIVANKSRSSGKPNAYYWSRYQNHFKLSSYKDTPAHKFEEARQYLLRLEGDGDDSLLSITRNELKNMIVECSRLVIGIAEKPKLDPNAKRDFKQLGFKVNEYEYDRILKLQKKLSRNEADTLRIAALKLADELLGGQ